MVVLTRVNWMGRGVGVEGEVYRGGVEQPGQSVSGLACDLRLPLSALVLGKEEEDGATGL